MMLVLTAILVAVGALGVAVVSAQEITPMPPGPGDIRPADFPANTITVTGIGNASGEPDLAYVELGVEMMNADLATAYAEAADTMQNVIQALVDAGVDRTDIRTSSVNIYPQDQYDPETGMPTDRTYRVSNTVRVTVRDVSMVESVINAAVNAGANTIYSFNFAIDDSVALEQQARISAVENARQRATELGQALGVTIGRPVVISETYGAFQPFPIDGRGGAMFDAAQSALPVSPGQLEISVVITVTFSIE